MEKRKKQKQGNKTKKKKMEEGINVEEGERESEEFPLVTIEQLRPAAAPQLAAPQTSQGISYQVEAGGNSEKDQRGVLWTEELITIYHLWELNKNPPEPSLSFSSFI